MRTAEPIRLNWRLSMGEIIGAAFAIASIPVTITLWSMATYQTKVDAKEESVRIEKRIDLERDEILKINDKLDKITSDVNYIRGKIDKQ